MRFSPGCSCCETGCSTCNRCTGTPVPSTLFVTFRNVTGFCGCIADEQTFQLDLISCSGGTALWQYGPSTPCGGVDSMTIQLGCGISIPPFGTFWQLEVTLNCSSGVSSSGMDSFAQELSCEPLEVTFVGGSWNLKTTGCGTMTCSTTVEATVTE